MRVQDNHAHADTLYKGTCLWSFYLLAANILETKSHKYSSLTVHLPFEIQHPKIYRSIWKGMLFIAVGEFLKKVVNIRLYWENAPEEVVKKWCLKYGQTEWLYVPRDIDLCLDIGHLIIGSNNLQEARKRIKRIIQQREKQIKHLHLHINRLRSDDHIVCTKAVKRVIGPKILRCLVKDRTYIFERGEE